MPDSKSIELILQLFQRDIERHYGGRTVGLTLNGEQATAQLNRLLEEARASELADYLSKRKISDTEQEVLQWAEERLAELKKDKI